MREEDRARVLEEARSKLREDDLSKMFEKE
jgi:hypothetical protein